MSGHVHDLVGIGLGPFNLGLAALAEPIDDLDAVFLEARPRFEWHPGLMLDEATLQVPFLADLVTLADPTSRWSFLAWLKATGRIYPFYLREHWHPLRREYSDYCRWVAEQLPSVRFGCPVATVEHDGEAYVVRTAGGEALHTRRLVLGVGSQPQVPDVVRRAGGPWTHTGDYLRHRERLQRCRRITIVGSGQSAAEVYRDLLAASPEHDYELVWLTRSPRFLPLEYTKLTLELTSPEHTAYFHALPPGLREQRLEEHQSLYRGISADLIDEISDLHHRLRALGHGPRTTLAAGCALEDAVWDGREHRLTLRQRDLDEPFEVATDGLVLGTGYATAVPSFLDPVRDRLRLDAQGRYDVGPHYAVDRAGGEIYVQNAEAHTHGLVAPDLGMGAHRSSIILREVLGREVYPIEERVAVQTFGVPQGLDVLPGRERAEALR